MNNTILINGKIVAIEEYFNIFENVNIAVCINKGDGEILYVNNITLKLFGYSRNEMIGMNVKSLYANLEDRAPIIRIIKEKGYINNYPVKLKKKNGGIIDCEFNTNITKDDNDNIILYGFIRDVSEIKKLQENILEVEDKNRLIVETTIEGMWATDENDILTLVDNKMAQILEYTTSEMIGKKADAFLFKEDLLDHQNKMEARVQGLSEIYERRFKKKGGDELWCILSSRPIVDEYGNFKGSFGTFLDISDKKTIEKKLAESDKIKKLILDSSKEVITYYDTNLRIVWGNKSITKSYGLKLADILGRHCYEIKYNRKTPCEHCNVLKVLETGKPIESEFHSLDDKIWDLFDSPVFDEFGNITNIVEFAIDVTEKKKFEESLKQSEEKFRSYVENAPDGVFVVDQNGRYIEINSAACTMSGYSKDELTLMEIKDLIPPDVESKNISKEHFDTIIKTGKSSGVVPHMRKDGTKRYWNIDAVKLSESVILGFAKDVTDKIKAEQILKDREATLSRIFDAAPVGILYVVNRKIVWASKSTYNLSGFPYDSLNGKEAIELYESEEESKRVGSILYGNLEKNDMPEVIAKLKRSDGTIFDSHIRIAPLDKGDLSKGFITILEDVTSKLKSQKQLDENLEYFAHLVDHIRNPLAIMSGFIQVETENEKLRDRLIRQIDRIEALIKELDQGWMDTEDTRVFLKKYM